MGSNFPLTEKKMADCRSKSNPRPPHDGSRDNANPTKNTTNEKDNHRDANITNGVESSTTNAANQSVVGVSGSPKDIICGRGLHIMSHHGNRNLHLTVDRYRQTYLTSTRKEKASITRLIVQELKSTGARFLRRFNDDGDKKWVVVDDKTAYKKVGHALRLRKSDQGQHFLRSLREQPRDSQRSLMLDSTSGLETSASQNVAVAVAAMPSGPQITMSHLSRISPSSSSVAMQLPSPSFQHPRQIAIQSQAASQPDVGIQPQPIVPPSPVSGYRNVVIDLGLYSQVCTNTLALMTQMQHQQRQSSNGSSADLRKSSRSPDEARRGNF